MKQDYPNHFSPYLFDLSTGNILTDPGRIEAVEKDRTPHNLYQLLLAGRFLVASMVTVSTAGYPYQPTSYDTGRLQPLEEVLQNTHLLINRGNYELLETTNWQTPEPYISSGLWLLDVIRETCPPPFQLKLRTLKRAHLLGIFPSVSQIINPKLFRNLTGYNNALGIKPRYRRGQYDRWTREQFAEYVERIFINKPSGVELERALSLSSSQGNGPSNQVVVDHADPPTKLLAERGYYMGGWTYNQQKKWGVMVMLVNNGREVGLPLIEPLSRRKRGPSEHSICDTFDMISKFKEVVKEEYKAKIAKIYEDIGTGNLPESLFKDETSDFVRVNRAAKYRLAKRLQLDANQQQLILISRLPAADDFVNIVRQYSPRLSKDAIQSKARELGLYDDIWTLEEAMEYLRVT